MTNQHPVNILAGSITGWRTLYRENYDGNLSEIEYIAANAAQWGADQELEACCQWLSFYSAVSDARDLRTARRRRPKPPSLKEQALEALEHILHNSSTDLGAETIRRALEDLDD